MKLDDQQPKKDVIYIDIDDDITSIIEKVKTASTAIVALVPPKRIGALQSVVNLKLLSRAADGAKKRVVLITSDHGLSALAAAVALPVAKNLQSKPEIADVPSVSDDADDVIDGEAILPVEAPDGSDTIEDGEAIASASEAAAAHAERASSRRSGATIPNFDAFRNKLALIVGGVLLLGGFLVWAIFFAPHATITIAAKTTPYGVSKALIAAPGTTLDAEKGTLSAVVKEIKKSVSVDFTATGKKDVGEKATGKVTFKPTGASAILNGVTIPAATKLTSSSDLSYTTDTAITIPPTSFADYLDGKTASATANVTAIGAGTKYNTDSGSLTGSPSGTTASFADATSGGTDKTVTVVSEQDAQTAKDKLQTQNVEAVKQELKKQFTTDSIVIEESFTTTPGTPSVVPAVDQEATTAKLTVETTYTLVGVARSDVRLIIEKDLTRQLAGLPNQSIYDQGMDKIQFTSYAKQDASYTMTIRTTGAVGPSIDSAALAKRLAGKREGEIIADVKTYEGIHDVKVSFSPFWVSTAPSADKMTIKFQIENAKN